MMRKWHGDEKENKKRWGGKKGEIGSEMGKKWEYYEQLRMRNPRFEKEVKMRRRGVDEEDIIVDSRKDRVAISLWFDNQKF